MSLDQNQIYNLLPAVYRIRDAQAAMQAGNPLNGSQVGPLQALIAILSEQVEVLQDSLTQSYDDLFIETCADWVVPYIADLVGLKGLVDVPSAGYTVRAAVADTIKNRRRKGTVSVLQSIATDVTNWQANVVEYFQVLATTQFMNHIRPANLSVSDIRRADRKLLNTPFDAYARTAEMRNIETGRGKYNIPNIGIYLWRLQQQQMEFSPACQIDERRFCFDPLGKNIPLFTLPATETASTPRATPLNVPMPISRWMLHGDLKGTSNYFGVGSSIYVSSDGGVTPTTEIRACNLSDVTDSSGHVIGWAHQPKHTIGIDPQLGRIVFPSAVAPPTNVQTTYCYGFMSEIGGGPYARLFSTQADVSVTSGSLTIQSAINEALALLSPLKNTVVVEIEDNAYYVETPTFTIPAGASVQLRAANGKRPTLVLSGDLVVTGGDASTFSLNGLLMAAGSLSVQQATISSAVTLQISHCTLNPASTPSIEGAPAQLPLPSLWIDSSNITINVDHSILGSIRIGSENTVSLTTCIVDAQSPTDVAYACYLDALSAGAPLTVINSTIIGKVHVQRMELASDSIFFAELDAVDVWTGPVLADQLQQGCVRFCYVPPKSRLPRCFNCYPVANQASSPAFTSLRFGDPGYCQLADRAGLLLTGADDNSEIGVFHDVYQPQRLSNLSTMIKDYLRFGMEAGVFFAT